MVWQPFICHRTGLTLRGLTREGPDKEECDESNEEDWRMEVEDNVECDGIDDILSDNEDKPQRNRQRRTL